MKYLLTLYGDESQMSNRSPERAQQVMQAWDVYTREAIDAGVHVGGEGLQPSATATTIKLEPSGDHIVTDGPFAETREQLGGYYLLDVENLDKAIEWAHKCPGAKYGTIELRPIQEFPDA